jgi:xylulokinase
MIYLGIDCGTQSLKLLAWNSETGEVDSTSRSYELVSGLPPGHKEQQPNEWISALEACMADLGQRGANLGGVAGIGVSGQQHGLVALDNSDSVLRPAKLWNDTSTGPECEAIMEAAGGQQAYMAEVGNLLPPGFTASKILWMKRNDPSAYSRLHSFMLPHDYLNLYLTGNKVAEAGDASGTGYFRVRERRWSNKALGWIDPERDLTSCLPILIESDQAAGELRPELAQRWGMSPKIVVSSGGGDNMMGAIGSGNVRPGTVTVSLGTSGTLFSFNDSPVVDPLGEIAAFCDSTGGWLPLACTMNVTVATEMVRSGFEIGELAALESAVNSVPPGCEGLLLLPYLEGERLPNVPNGTGVLLGLRGATANPSFLARSAMEGVTLGLRYGLDRLKELGAGAQEIRLIGGGSKSKAWRQIAADVFQVPVVCPKLQEGPAIGAALQACWCTSGEELGSLLSRSLELDESTRCLPGNLELYSELYGLYLELSRTLNNSGVFGSHRNFIQG